MFYAIILGRIQCSLMFLILLKLTLLPHIHSLQTLADHDSVLHTMRRKAIRVARKMGFKKKNKRVQVIEAVEETWDTNQSVEDLERIVWEQVSCSDAVCRLILTWTVSFSWRKSATKIYHADP